MMNHSSSEPRDAAGAFRVWAYAQRGLRILRQAGFGRAEVSTERLLRAEALAAIEATADLTWWDLVNYHGAWS